ncbi:MAG TPA: phosphate ABC transporter permease subunit PstC [Thermomicrobiales bacterium]|nr:phosphate ABC transporter permease subunit PstC [Thermomicrobiales bacterium]
MAREPVDLSGKRNRNASEALIAAVLFLFAAFSLLVTLGIGGVLLFEAVRFFREVPVTEFLFGNTWTALFLEKEWGVLPLVRGTLVVTLIALLVAVPLGLMSAVYLSEYAGPRVRSILKPALELLAGVPTIVYGYFALTFITPSLLKPLFGREIHFQSALAAGIAVGIMILPLMASLAEDTIRAVPYSLREGAYALGATKLETSLRVVVPAATSGIVAAFILSMSRAVGETMIVALAAGARPADGWNPLEGMQTMTAYIVAVFTGDVVYGSLEFQSLFAVGLLLFLMTLTMNILSQWIARRYRKVYQ